MRPAVTTAALDPTAAPGAKTPTAPAGLRGGERSLRGGSRQPLLRPQVRRRARGQSLGRGLLGSWRAGMAGRRGKVPRAVAIKC